MNLRLCVLWSQWTIGFAWEDELIASACENAWGVWFYLGPFSVKLSSSKPFTWREDKNKDEPWHSLCHTGAWDPDYCDCDFCFKHKRDIEALLADQKETE